jgi:hypothetical protein
LHKTTSQGQRGEIEVKSHSKESDEGRKCNVSTQSMTRLSPTASTIG